MRSAPRALFAVPIAVLAISLAGCGSSSGLLSNQQSAALQASLGQIKTALDQRNCSAAQSETIVLKSRVANLPSSVNGTVRSSLTQAAAKLEQLVLKDCAPVTTTVQPQPTTTATTTTTTTVTTAPPAPKKKPKPQTTPATTTTQTGTTTGTSPGPGNGKGNGNGNGKGKGGGGGDSQGGGDPPTTTTPTTPANP